MAETKIIFLAEVVLLVPINHLLSVDVPNMHFIAFPYTFFAHFFTFKTDRDIYFKFYVHTRKYQYLNIYQKLIFWFYR